MSAPDLGREAVEALSNDLDDLVAVGRRSPLSLIAESLGVMTRASSTLRALLARAEAAEARAGSVGEAARDAAVDRLVEAARALSVAAERERDGHHKPVPRSIAMRAALYDLREAQAALAAPTPSEPDAP